jgi:hypothetical protein
MLDDDNFGDEKVFIILNRVVGEGLTERKDEVYKKMS